MAGTGPEPGDLSWIGPITPAQARELAAAAAADPACTWALIVTDDQGRAVAITTLRTRRATGTGPPGLVSEVTLTITRSLATALASARLPRSRQPAPLAEHPGPDLPYPVCRQPAARCDQDHTIAYHRGGRTCSCNLGGS